MKILLTSEEQKIAKFIGGLREKRNSQAGIANSRVDSKRSNEEIHIDGFGAELAFARMFNLYPDFTTQPRKGGVDFTRNGLTIDVKSSTYSPTWLTTKNNKKLGDATIYVMLTGVFPEYSFAGWHFERVLLLEENLRTWGGNGGHPMYSLSPDRLLSFELLKRVLGS